MAQTENDSLKSKCVQYTINIEKMLYNYINKISSKNELKKRCLIFSLRKWKLSHLLTFAYKVGKILLFIIFKRDVNHNTRGFTKWQMRIHIVVGGDKLLQLFEQIGNIY